MKTVKARKKVKIFLESVMKTVFYVKRAPLNSDVGSLTLPLITYFYTYTFLYSFTGLTPLKGVGPLGVVVDPFPEFQSIIQKILERLMETKTLKSFQIPKCLLFPQFHHGKFLLNNNNNNNSPPILLSTKPEYHRVELQ